MATVKSSAENLTLNADGSGNDIVFQSNGSNVGTLDQAGLLTATTFAGSGASLTALNATNLGSGTVPDARFPATLPATSAANLTAIPAANITGTLPAISGANLTNLPVVNPNMIINGAMLISQRQGTASFALTDSTFGIDRFKYVGQTSRLTSQQVTDSPAGFAYSFKLTSVGANTPSASHGNGIWMQLEGNDVGHLNYGTSDAQTTTLSFWVKSSLTGTFGGAFANSALNRSYPYTYVISSADTWEKKSITVAGDTTGTWVTTGNSIGLRMYINTGTGSNFNGSAAGSWTGADRRDVSGTVQLEATSGATLQITGVKLELGSTATDFPHRGYAEELALCMRYYYALAGGTTAIGQIGYGGYTLTNYLNINGGNFPVPMRANPSFLITNGTNYWAIYRRDANDKFDILAASTISPTCFSFAGSGNVSGTQADPGTVSADSASAKIHFSAEL